MRRTSCRDSGANSAFSHPAPTGGTTGLPFFGDAFREAFAGAGGVALTVLAVADEDIAPGVLRECGELVVEVDQLGVGGQEDVAGQGCDRRDGLFELRDTARVFFVARETEARRGDLSLEVSILDAGRATLELSDVPHAEHIDLLEVGRRVAGQIRVALKVPDAGEATDRLVAGGATLIAAPRPTPWGSLNSRLDAPGPLQLTLFQEVEPEV